MNVKTDIQTRFIQNYDEERLVEIDQMNGGDSESFLTEIRHLWPVGIVAVDEADDPLGFCIYSLEDKESYNILHLVVDKDYQRQGIGAKLIYKMKAKLNDKRNQLVYEIPESNLSGLKFLKSMGFISRLVRCSPEDVIRFTYKKD